MSAEGKSDQTVSRVTLLWRKERWRVQWEAMIALKMDRRGLCMHSLSLWGHGVFMASFTTFSLSANRPWSHWLVFLVLQLEHHAMMAAGDPVLPVLPVLPTILAHHFGSSRTSHACRGTESVRLPPWSARVDQVSRISEATGHHSLSLSLSSNNRFHGTALRIWQLLRNVVYFTASQQWLTTIPQCKKE